MRGKRKKSLVEELNDVAFAAPRAEDFLEKDLEGAPLILTDDHEGIDEKNEGLEAQQQNLRFLKGTIEIEGADYSGQGVSRKDIFEEELSEQLSSDVASLQGESEMESGAEGEGVSGEGDLYEEYEKIQSDVGINDLKLRAKKDRERGQAVQRDRHLWGTCLEMRILLQKSLTASHQLPPAANKTHLLSTAPETHRTLYVEVLDLTKSVLCDLIDLENARWRGKRQKTDSGAPWREETSAESLWECLEERYSSLNAFCNASLDRFHQQAMLQSGATTGKGNLHTLHQGISVQMHSLMQAPRKALLKAKMPVADQPRVLGVSSSTQATEIHSSPTAEADKVNHEMFVDTEFYQTLLNEYLLSHGMEPLPLQKVRKRGSQGDSGKKMRARYSQVQEKLINFMTPTESDVPAFATQLFRNLFSQ